MLQQRSMSVTNRPLLLSLLLVLIFLSQQVLCFQFYLHGGEKRCFTETAPPNTKILGEYTVSTGKGHMPVDITVNMAGHHVALYSRKNVDHGKFGFVVPFEGGDVPKVYKAELHRKMKDHMHRVHHRNGRVDSAHDDYAHSHHRRRLLSVDEHDHHNYDQHNSHHDSHGHYDDHYHNDLHHGEHYDDSYHHNDDHHHDEHSHDTRYHDDPHHNYHDDDHHRDYHHDYHPDDHHHDDHHHDDHHDDFKHIGHQHNVDSDDYDYDDDLDDFDADEYDGISDKELEEEEEKITRTHQEKYGTLEDASAEDQEDRLFDVKKFEICVISGDGGSHDFKRRVRLIVHKGATAHDYTRLAKKEHMTQLEVSLRQVSSELNELMNELDQARRMEDILRQLNENTNKRVVIFSVISLISLFAVGGYQAFYTKRFFKRKKIL